MPKPSAATAAVTTIPAVSDQPIVRAVKHYKKLKAQIAILERKVKLLKPVLEARAEKEGGEFLCSGYTVKLSPTESRSFDFDGGIATLGAPKLAPFITINYGSRLTVT
jgi:hypothetical protein